MPHPPKLYAQPESYLFNLEATRQNTTQSYMLDIKAICLSPGAICSTSELYAAVLTREGSLPTAGSIPKRSCLKNLSRMTTLASRQRSSSSYHFFRTTYMYDMTTNATHEHSTTTTTEFIHTHIISDNNSLYYMGIRIWLPTKPSYS